MGLSDQSSSSSLSRFFAAIFAPPFRGLPMAVWCYFVVCFLVHPHSLILQGNLPDSDDYMYLAQLRDWLAGQGWFDNVQHRLNAPAGVFIDFSRLTELPMAGIAGLLGPWLGATRAALIMAAILPLLWLAGLFAALQWAAENFMPKDWTRVTAFLALFATYLMFQFSPGHIDHHGLTALLILMGFGCTARMICEPEKWLWPLGAGFFVSLALAVGLEVLPPLLLLSSLVGLWAVVRGGIAARSAAIYGLILSLSAFVFLTVTLPPDHWLIPDPLGFSIIYVLLTFGIAFIFGGIALAALSHLTWLRYAAAILLAGTAGFLFLQSFPSLIGGPYGAMNPDLARFFFAHIDEAMPVLTPTTSPVAILLRFLWPMMALAAGIGFWRTAKTGETKWVWGMAVLLLLSQMLLAAFYQQRFMVFAELFSIIPLAALLPPGFSWIKENSTGAAIGFLQLELLLLIAPLPTLFLPALIDGRSFNTGIMLFPVVADDTYTCDMQALARQLTEAHAEPTTLMNEMFAGPELLFRTHDLILGAPFHRNVEGALDTVQFFGATDPEVARYVARKRDARFVILCHKMVPLYRTADRSAKSFAEQLEDGTLPSWLKPVSYPGEGDYLLFEIIPSGENSAAPL